MAPVAKRRKLSPLGDGTDFDDASSFASFGEAETNALLNGPGDKEEMDAAMDDSDVSGRDDDVQDGRFPPEDGDDDVEEDDEDDDASTNEEGSPDIKPAEQDVKPNGKQRTKGIAQSQVGKAVDGAKGRPRGAPLANTSIPLFQLQVDDLLGTLRPQRSSRNTAAEACLHDLKSIFESLPSKAPQAVVNAEREMIKKHRVAIPFPDPRPAHDAQYKLDFLPPKMINVVGSYALGTGIGGDELSLDMLIQMPDALFQDKDYRDHRFFYRRAYWLACLAAGVQEKYDAQFESHSGNPLLPILVIRSSDSTESNKWKINILPSISEKVFANDRLALDRINAKLAGVLVNQQIAGAFYNSSIQLGRQMIAYLKLTHSATTSSDTFKDACILLKTWLRQRGFSSTVQAGGFGGFEATALMAALISSGSLSPKYSSVQLFKATLQFLAARDLTKAPATIGQGPAVSNLSGYSVLFDHARSHNLAYKMTPWSARALRTAARATLSLLSDSASDHFDATFIIREDILHLKYDLNLALPLQLVTAKDITDQEASQMLRSLGDVLRRGLGDRITAMSFTTDSCASWPLGSARPSWSSKGDVVIGLRLNPAIAGRSVDHGPSAEDKVAATEFRKFWGDKAELRRFKDGRILESLVWSGKTGTQALMVEIITYLVERHVGSAAATAMMLLGGSLAKTVTQVDSLSSFEPVMEASKILENDIRGLSELPLAIRQISTSDPQARFSSIIPPSAQSPPIDVVVQFESSARWPEDLHAIHRVKAAFLLKLSELLTESNPDLTSRVGLENGSVPSINQCFLDITYPTSITFRVRIHHEREVSLINKVLKAQDSSASDRDAATSALAHYKRTFIATPQHTSSVAKLATRFPALSGAIRLLKQWFASHLLSSHFPDAMIELFAIHTFLSPAPYPSAPGSPQTGLLRTLAHLSRWDWRTEPLVITDPSSTNNTPDDSFTPSSSLTTHARARFTAWRRLDPSMTRIALFVASPADPDGTTWSDTAAGGPRIVAAARMSSLARAATNALRSTDTASLDLRRLFVPDASEYDFVLRVCDPTAHRTKKSGKDGAGKFKNLALPDHERDGAFDPFALFLDEVRALFGHALVLFYAPGAKIVGGLWSPSVTAPRAWKVGLGYTSLPTVGEGGETLAVVNRRAVLAEVARLGGELVAGVEVREGDA